MPLNGEVSSNIKGAVMEARSHCLYENSSEDYDVYIYVRAPHDGSDSAGREQEREK